MEGLPADYPLEEIVECFDRFGVRLFKHLEQAYGLRYVALTQLNGNLCTLQLQLVPVPYRQGDSRSTYVEGLTLLNVLHLTVESQDLEMLIPNPVGLAAIKDDWKQAKPLLTRILPHELIEKLEQAARVAAFHPEEKSAEQQMESFAEWAIRNGLRIPGNASEAREAANQQAIAARRRAEDERFAEHESSWSVREMP